MQHDQLRDLTNSDRRRLIWTAVRLLGQADAEDAVQDAYLRALETETLDLNSAKAWLLTVVRNLAIDRIRRRSWMQQWLAEMSASDTLPESPSAEMDAALSEEVTRALRLLATNLTPMDGAAVLLLEVFEVGHAEIAKACGRSEDLSRQQLRRALLRLRKARDAPEPQPHAEVGQSEETIFRLYLQSMKLRDPQALWAMLRQPPILAMALGSSPVPVAETAPPCIASGVVQVGGQLGLVLTLDGVTLCVLPLGAQQQLDASELQPA